MAVRPRGHKSQKNRNRHFSYHCVHFFCYLNRHLDRHFDHQLEFLMSWEACFLSSLFSHYFLVTNVYEINHIKLLELWKWNQMKNDPCSCERNAWTYSWPAPNISSLFQEFGWWGVGKKLGRRRKLYEGKNRAGKGREGFLAAAPVSPRFFPLVFLFALGAYDLTCSPLSKRLEQATTSVAS